MREGRNVKKKLLMNFFMDFYDQTKILVSSSFED